MPERKRADTVRRLAPELDFLTQPGLGATLAASALADLLGDPEIDEVTIVVAWLRYRGLVRLRHELDAFRARGGRLRIVLGVDEGGATRPGLLLAVRLADEAFVYHDKGAGTFHPKAFFGEGPRKAVLIVGSSNATPGGLFSNYEASLRATFALPLEEVGAVSDFRAFVAGLLAERELCLQLDAETVDQLVADPSIDVSGHEHPRGRGARDAEGGAVEAPVGIFGRRSTPVTRAPALTEEDLEELRSMEIGIEEEPQSSPGVPDTPSTVVLLADDPTVPVEDPPLVLHSWAKKLPQGDAQQNRNPRTNPTGDVRLTRAGHAIDQTVYFRNEMFAGLTWLPTEGSDLESAEVDMDVTVDGGSAGVMRFVVTHAPHRESDQGNFTTKLMWGPLLQTMKAIDYTGYTLSLTAMSDAGYRMDISAS